MKIRNSIFNILTIGASFNFLLLLSCSDDNDRSSGRETAAINAYKTTNALPFNSSNAYDYTGILHNEILAAYYQSAHLPTSASAILARVDSIAIGNHDFNSIKGLDYHAPELGRLEYILSHKITSATNIISSSAISVTAKSSLSNFASALFAFSTSEDDYEVIYSFIKEYENDVIKSTTFTASDKEVILTVSAIARHSMYSKKKRPKKNMDPDWDVLVSNIIASIEGARFGQAEAIVLGLAAGIAENPK